MSALHLDRRPDARTWIPVLAPLGIAVIAALIGLNLGIAWRQTLAVTPTDPTPIAGLLTAAVVGSSTLVAGVAFLSIGERERFGAGSLAFGVGWSCGVIIGFWPGLL